MVSTKVEQTKAISASVLFLKRIFDYLLPKKNKTHNYTSYQSGVDYFFEVTACGTRAYMTGQGKGIRVKDYLLLQPGVSPARYQVESIDYYASPSDTWIAQLKQIP